MKDSAIADGGITTMGGNFIPIDKDGSLARKAVNYYIQGCLPSRSRVLTRVGYTPIGTFTDGDEVWTGRQWSKAVKLNRGEDELVRLELSDGRVFECDTRHKLLCYEGGYPDWFTVDECTGREVVVNQYPITGSMSDQRPSFWYWWGRYYGDGYGARREVWWIFGHHERDDAVMCRDFWESQGLRATLSELPPKETL